MQGWLIPFMLKSENKLTCLYTGYSSLPGSANCSACPPGTVGRFASAPTCTPCATGSYNSEYGQTVCGLCPAGIIF